MPGRRSIFRARDGLALTRRRACYAARAICRYAERRITAPARRCPASLNRRSVISVSKCASIASGRPHASQRRSRTTPGRGSTDSAKQSIAISLPRMCDSPWAANRLSSPSTTSSRPNGTRRRSDRQNASAPTISCVGCARVSRRAASCTTVRANGIRAKVFRAGPSAYIGARTVAPYGAIRRS